jgi:chemotaxis methyl-accepting protein methylase
MSDPHPPAARAIAQVAPSTPPERAAADDTVEARLVGAIVAVVHERTGRDFSGYRVGTTERRIVNRMISAGIGSMEEYLRYLRATPDEAWLLLDRLTIKVSRFYRHAPTFDLLRQEVPRLAAARHDGPLRAWSAGCGYGEETYTLAMLLDEAGLPASVLGTDIDPGALAAAHTAEFAGTSCEELPASLAVRYLVPMPGSRGGRARVDARLCAGVRFAQHDVTSGTPPPGDAVPFDLICCRNVLIYLQPHVQARTLAGVAAVLRPGGLLVLGEAEWPAPPLTSRLEVVDRKARVFRATDAVRLEGLQWVAG